jgi:predicted transposase YbfD/YdcC
MTLFDNKSIFCYNSWSFVSRRRALVEVPVDLPFLRHFASLKDPRIERTKLHSLMDIIALTICGVLCGADGWDDLHFYACALEPWYRTFLSVANGIPSSDTIRRVISAIRPDHFHACFLSWVQSIAKHIPESIIAIDGKTLRSAYGPDDPKALLHIVSAWSEAQHLVLAAVNVEEKSNEIPAIPELLKLLAIEGCIVTIDAIGCQKKITHDIVEKKAGYAITVKENQETLYNTIVQTFAEPPRTEGDAISTSSVTEERDHGRYERRTYTVTNDLSRLATRAEWTGLTHIGMVTCERIIDETYQQETRYYILSRVETAEKLAEASRGHWGIENRVHWVLDVTFHEDAIRIYDGYGAENLATVRKMALNALTRENTRKLSMKKKRALCSMKPEYMMKVLESVANEA